jgi:HSP20 family protein
MNLSKSQTPLAPLGSLRREMDELFGRFLEDWSLPGFGIAPGREIWPAVDVAEKGDKVVVEAELPGLTVDDIQLSVLENTLTLSGEKKAEKEEKGENYYHIERHHGSFTRSIPLPTRVDTDHVNATFHDGVLTVELPKDVRSMPRRIELKK